MLRNTNGHPCLGLTVAFAACLIMAASPSAWGQCLVNRLLASDGGSDDDFGWDLAMNGQYLLVGAKRTDDQGFGSGAAYVFEQDEWDWVEQQKLLPSDGYDYDYFGCSVAISGNAAVIGAYGDDDNGDWSGSAYVFRDAGPEWMEQTKLLPGDGEEGDQFGASVGVSIGAGGQVAIVGAPDDDNDNGEDAGAAYVFRFDGIQWSEEAKLLASDGTENDAFGTSVAIEEDLIIVGALHADGVGEYSGSAYVFRCVDGAWLEDARLAPTDEEGVWHFGESLSLDGDVVVVGAPWSYAPGVRTGAAFVFQYGSGVWKEQAKLLASDGEAWDQFGQAVALSGDLIAAGAPWDRNEVGMDAGAVYIFQRDRSNWIEVAKLLPFDYEGPDDPCFFGLSVVMDGTTPLVGSPRANGVGAVYVMDIGEPDCNWNDYCDWYDIANAVSTDCDDNTVPDECEAYETSRLLASDGQAGDYFGYAVSLSGPAAVIGAINDDDNGENTGSAYVYRHADDVWSEEDKLTASDGEADDRFGMAAAIDGNLVAVGAPRDDDNGENSGSAYVFRHNGVEWIEEAKILPGDGAPDDSFGTSVGISGDVLIAGADNDDDNGEDAGAAYIFRFTGDRWSEEAKLLASDGAEGDAFGDSVDICGDTVIIGAPNHDGNGDNSGAAYLFTCNGSAWIETAKLVTSDAEAGDYFGGAIAIRDDLAVIGATGDDGAEEFCGSASVFRYDGSDWIEEAKIFASDGASIDMFGISVATNGETVLIGAGWDDDDGSRSGSTYIYRYDGTDWVELKITAPDAGEEDRFGHAVAVDGDHILIGAISDDDNGILSGAAYMFDGLLAADCNINGNLDWCDIADGVSDDINQNGIPDECECPADLNGDETVDIDDVFAVLAAWGPCDDCIEDVNADGFVDIDDLFGVLSAWGPCP